MEKSEFFIMHWTCWIWYCNCTLQAGELVSLKAKVDESEGKRAALEDHIITLKVSWWQ